MERLSEAKDIYKIEKGNMAIVSMETLEHIYMTGRVDGCDSFEYASVSLPKGTIILTEDERREIDMPKEDVVNHPSHYEHSSIECIDAMEAMMEGADIPDHDGYLWGNIFKYLWRWPFKAGLQDLKKAQWYLERLIENREVEEGNER